MNWGESTMLQRRNYLITSGGIFLGVALIASALVFANGKALEFMEISMPFPLYALIAGFGFGWMISGFYTGIHIFISLVRDKSIFVKVLCGVLFPLVYFFVTYVGILGLFPYFIVNLIKYRKELIAGTG